MDGVLVNALGKERKLVEDNDLFGVMEIELLVLMETWGEIMALNAGLEPPMDLFLLLLFLLITGVMVVSIGRLARRLLAAMLILKA